MRRYRSAGRLIASDIHLPALTTVADSSVPDLVVCPGSVVDVGGSRDQHGWRYHAGALTLIVPGEVVLHIDQGGGRITYDPAGSRLESLPAYICGSALGAALQLAGSTVLHAGSVLVGDRAVLFLGAAGAGKSTIVAALAERGHRVLCDDVARLGMSNGAITVAPDGRRLKLWEAAIGHLALADRRGPRVIGGVPKYHVDVAPPPAPGDEAFSHHPVSAIYALAWAGSGQPRSAALRTAEIFANIMSNAYRPALVSVLGAQMAYFDLAEACARTLTVRGLWRPPDFAVMDAVLDLVEIDLDTGGRADQ